MTTAKVKAREKRKAAAEGDPMDTDENFKTKKDRDVEMKPEEVSSVSSGKHGNISPINGSISNLAEDGKPLGSKTHKGEPMSETLPNFSRFTPTQLAHIHFPADGRYQPVCAVSTKASTKSGKSAVQPMGNILAMATLGIPSKTGGGIFILVDQLLDEDAEFIKLTVPAVVAMPADVTHILNLVGPTRGMPSPTF